MKRFYTRMAALALAVLCTLTLCAAPIASAERNTPKYVFLFIGDGMTYSQFQLAASFQGANTDTDADGILDGDAKYDADYVASYRENNTPFAEAMKDVQELFGLVLAAPLTALTSGIFLAKNR